jgi:signal transduction histidine kinase
LIAANNELIRLSEFKAQFVHLATYELRNPIKLLIKYIKMLLDGQVGPLTENQSEVLKIVQNNGLRLKSMIDELLNAVRLESGQIDLELKPVDLVSLVNEVVSENAAQIQSKEQVLDLQFSPQLPPALCDEDWTKQIMTNLLQNAVKYTPVSGHISILLRLADQPGFLQLSVADTAAGIPEQERSEIFSGLFQSKSTSPQSALSPSRGLHITRTLVELNGGSIWFDSQLNLGSVFHVTLPIAS